MRRLIKNKSFLSSVALIVIVVTCFVLLANNINQKDQKRQMAIQTLNTEVSSFVTKKTTPQNSATKLYAYDVGKREYVYNQDYLPSTLRADAIEELRGIVRLSLFKKGDYAYKAGNFFTTESKVTYYDLKVIIVDLKTNTTVAEKTFTHEIEGYLEEGIKEIKPDEKEVQQWILDVWSEHLRK